MHSIGYLRPFSIKITLALAILAALPAQTARADYAPGPAAIPGILFDELKSEACMAEITTDKKTPLMRAAEAGNAEKVKALIAAGADVNAKNNKENTALDIAQCDEIKEILRKTGAKAVKDAVKE